MVLTPIRSIQEGLHLRHRALAILVALGVLAMVGVVILFAARSGRLPLVAAGSAGLIVLLISFRWPLIPLVAFVALIPIEDILVIDELGTLSKFAAALFAVAYAAPRIRRLTLSAMPLAAYAFVGWALVSMLWASDVGVAWAQLTTLLQLFVIAILIADVVVHRPEVVRTLLWAYAIPAAIAGLLAVQQFVTASGFSGRATFDQEQDPAQLAGLLLPALVFSLYELIEGRKLILSAAVALVTFVGVVISGTRGAWVSLGVVFVLFLLPRLRPAQRVAAVVAMTMLILVTLQIPSVSQMIAERSESALNTGGAGRTDIWSVGANIYARSPVLGTGYANFPVQFTDDVIRDTDVGSYARNNPAPRGPHNVVVGTLAELGPLGLFLLGAFLVPLALRTGWGPDGKVVQACLVSLLTMALALDIVGNRKQVWLLIGIAAGLGYLARRRRARPAEPPARPVPAAPVGMPPAPALQGPATRVAGSR